MAQKCFTGNQSNSQSRCTWILFQLMPHQFLCNLNWFMAITTWNKMIVQTKMDANCSHIKKFVHNTINPSIIDGTHIKGVCYTICIYNYGMQRKDMSRQKCIICCIFPMDFIGFSISQQTWAIFHYTTQMTNTSGSPKIQSIIVFYVGGFHHTPKVAIVFPIHTLLCSTMVVAIVLGRNLNKMFPLNSWNKKGTWTILMLLKYMLRISILHHDALVIFLKQWMTLLLEEFNPPENVKEGGPSKGRFQRSRNSTSKRLKEQAYAWIEWIEKLERGNWLGVNAKNTWLGSSRIKGFDRVATLICSEPTQTTRLGINHNIIIICTITKVKNIPWNKRFTFHFCGVLFLLLKGNTSWNDRQKSWKQYHVSTMDFVLPCRNFPYSKRT